jgi:hypothetical protein
MSPISNFKEHLTSRGVRARILVVTTAVIALIVAPIGSSVGASGDSLGTPTTTTTLAGIPMTLVGGGGGDPTWGVDTVDDFTSTMLSQIEHYPYGTPTFVGRYLNDGSYSLGGKTEANQIHNLDLNILLITFPSGSTSTELQGEADANTAMKDANADGATADSGVAIYDDFEPGVTIGTDYVIGWYNQMETDGYIPGFYHNEATNFTSGFCTAVSERPAIGTGTLLYSVIPQIPNSGPPYDTNANYVQGNAPAWTTTQPATPSCVSPNQDGAWQYLLGYNTTDGIPTINFDADWGDAVGLFS